MARTIRYHVIARGRVQSVGCRFFVCMEARPMGITGYVENLYDGTVQMELQGDPVQLSELLDVIRKGNGYMEVEDLDITEIPVKPGERQFLMS